MTKLFLAPMAGLTDSAFRQICKEHGADITVSEMISAKAVCFQDQKTFLLADFSPKERPLLIQIFGSEPHTMAKAAQVLANRFSPDGIDINMGCPVGKIIKSGDGSALMKDPSLVYEITSRVVEAVSVPVSVKIRSGRTPATCNAPEVALAAKKGGASLITVHGKTASQLYAPPVDYTPIRLVKQAVGPQFPVVGNGEITDEKSALTMLRETGCDHLMIGRAALGRPWIFQEIKAALQKAPFTPPEGEQVRALLKRHLSLACKQKGAAIAIREMRKHIAAYIKGFPGASVLRDQINRTDNEAHLLSLIDQMRIR